MARFEQWLKANVSDRPMFVADNNGFDWQFINWYFHHFLGRNSFGFSSMNLGSLYKGLMKDTFANCDGRPKRSWRCTARQSL